MKKILLLLCFIASVTTAGSQNLPDAEYRQAIGELMEAANMAESVEQMIPEMFSYFRTQYNTVPSEVWEIVEKETISGFSEDFVELLIPIYKKHFTTGEIREIAKFYKSPTGKKLAKATGEITIEAMQAGQNWAVSLLPKIKQKLIEQGYGDYMP